MNPILAEFVGTAILIIFGDGVVANVVLNKTKGNGGGWIVITFGWAMAVFIGVFCVTAYSGAHLNPAVTIGLAAGGKFAWSQVPMYIFAQIAGGFVGGAIVYFFYIDHFKVTDDATLKLAVFCTIPNIYLTVTNFACEVIGTFMLIFPIFMMVNPSLAAESAMPGQARFRVGLGALGALPVALLALAIGLSLGGTTGYAINPARDLGPRLAHALLPIPGKRDSDWGYAWIPIVGPIAGALLAAAASHFVTAA